MHIELRMLRALVMVEASGSITRAADGLAFSPAAVSEHLRALERECGVRLVERSGSGTALTEEGRRAVPIARLMLAAAVELERLGRPPDPGRRDAIPPGPPPIKSSPRDREVR